MPLIRCSRIKGSSHQNQQKFGRQNKYNMSAGRKEEKHEKIIIPAVGNNYGFYPMCLRF